MKTLILSILLMSNLMLMCKNDSVKQTIKEETSKNKVVKPKEKSTQKSANYDALFTAKKDIFLTPKEIAKATGLPISSISVVDEKLPYHYFYKIKLPNGEEMKFDYYVFLWNKKEINKNIKSYLKTKKRGENKITKTDIEISDTGDCYLTHQKNAGRLMIMNPNYNNVIYSSWAKLAVKLNEEQKQIRIDKARKILNYLLKKYRK